MNPVCYGPDEPPRGQSANRPRRGLKPLDSYRVPDYATGALPVSPVGRAALAVALIGLVLSLFPLIGLLVGVPADVCALALATWAARRVRQGRERGLNWCLPAALIALAAIALAVFLSSQEMIIR
ncbi:MAG: hypothetical protein LBG60_09595 [Bifidobacteriaceae bacterium]|jgi:hypothetical protein|nr:hypothetical protein [Bifidobacteriaceae bacterium]